ncbi:BRCT domain-containing protein [Hypomontagnella monticulosa]|nr:BRCT domain-containing protein [Hypomontagnella monticulosa]
MESSPAPERAFDPSKPFEGLVLCCTNIEADLRAKIAQQTSDLGGTHKYDLTPDVTHLIVGDYDTAKYRHVARERPDIKPMAVGWVEAVKELWVNDRELDFVALESAWKLKTFETGGGELGNTAEGHNDRTKLTCCLTGFEENETRVMIEDKVKTNGGDYVGDLSRRVTHLIVCKPEGKKYVAARKWGIRTVSIEWLHDSVERGMILNEECYDPTLPAEERGKGAWIRRELKRGASLGKRSRGGTVALPADDGRRKLRKTASMKFTSQRDNLWGDILVNQSSTDLSKGAVAASADDLSAGVSGNSPAADSVAPMVETPQLGQGQDEKGIFNSCRFYVHGFSRNKQEIVQHHLSSHDGQISESIEDAASSNHREPLDRRYLVVPQTSQPDSHPQLPEGMHIITEFYIERCVHNRILLDPHDHVLGQPFPQFPVKGFQELTICTAGFRNEQLNQVEKAIVQLGAKYSERLNSQCSLLVCPSLDGVRKQKLDFATFSGIPVVEADWLWQCITTGCLVPSDSFLFKELTQNNCKGRAAPQSKEKDKIQKSRSEPMPRKDCRPNRTAPGMKHGIDMTAFDDDTPMPPAPPTHEPEAADSNYETAPTQQAEEVGVQPATTPAPLSEMTSNALNKSPSPQKSASASRKLKRFPTGGEVGDSEDGEELDVPIKDFQRDDSIAKSEEEERKRRAQEAKDAEHREMSNRLNCIKPQQGPKQRSRVIFGRAASNVSTASSASAESVTHMSSAKSNFRRTESATSRLGSIRDENGAFRLLDMQHDGDGNHTMEDGDSVPPATQIGYDNSEGRAQRKKIEGQIRAGSEGVDQGATRLSQEKVTSMALKMNAETMSMSTTTSRSTTTRRAMRKR